MPDYAGDEYTQAVDEQTFNDGSRAANSDDISSLDNVLIDPTFGQNDEPFNIFDFLGLPGLSHDNQGNLVQSFDGGSIDLGTGQITDNGSTLDPTTGVITDQNGDEWWQQRDGTYANINTGDVWDPNSGITQSQSSYAQENSFAANPVSYGNQYISTFQPPTGFAGAAASQSRTNTPSGGMPSGTSGGGTIASAGKNATPDPNAANPLTALLNGILSGLAKGLTTPKVVPTVGATPRLPGTANMAANRTSVPTQTANLPSAARSALTQNSGLLLWGGVAVLVILILKSHGNRSTAAK